QRQPGLRAGTASTCRGLRPHHPAGTSEPQSGAGRCPPLCTPRPFLHRQVSQGCGSEKQSGRYGTANWACLAILVCVLKPSQLIMVGQFVSWLLLARQANSCSLCPQQNANGIYSTEAR